MSSPKQKHAIEFKKVLTTLELLKNSATMSMHFFVAYRIAIYSLKLFDFDYENAKIENHHGSISFLTHKDDKQMT